MFIRFDAKKRRFKVDDRFVSPASVLSTRWLLHALEQARPFAGEKLLDVGCGSKPYKDLFGATEHIGVDWTNSLHKLCVEAFSSAEALPLSDGVFDVTLCTETIEHLKHPSLVINEMVRVLKPGGHLILSAPFVHELHEAPFDFFRFTPLGLRSLVEEAGLTPIAMYCRGGAITVLVDIWSRLVLSLIRSVLGRMSLSMKIQNTIVTILLVWPQRIFASIAIGLTKYATRRRSAGLLGTASRVSLGYVLVARRQLEPTPIVGGLGAEGMSGISRHFEEQ